MTTMAVALDRNLFLAYYSSLPLIVRLVYLYIIIIVIVVVVIVVVVVVVVPIIILIFLCSLSVCLSLSVSLCLDVSTRPVYLQTMSINCRFPVLTMAYDNNGRCPRQKFVFGILQLLTN